MFVGLFMLNHWESQGILWLLLMIHLAILVCISWNIRVKSLKNSNNFLIWQPIKLGIKSKNYVVTMVVNTAQKNLSHIWRKEEFYTIQQLQWIQKKMECQTAWIEQLLKQLILCCTTRNYKPHFRLKQSIQLYSWETAARQLHSVKDTIWKLVQRKAKFIKPKSIWLYC